MPRMGGLFSLASRDLVDAPVREPKAKKRKRPLQAGQGPAEGLARVAPNLHTSIVDGAASINHAFGGFSRWVDRQVSIEYGSIFPAHSPMPRPLILLVTAARNPGAIMPMVAILWILRTAIPKKVTASMS